MSKKAKKACFIIPLVYWWIMAEVEVSQFEELKQDIWEKVALVEDPEIGLSITELGLIYDIQVQSASKANISMTFTSMGCPYGPQLKAQVHAAATRVVSDVEVEIVFSPPWDPLQMASEEAKSVMGIY